MHLEDKVGAFFQAPNQAFDRHDGYLARLPAQEISVRALCATRRVNSIEALLCIFFIELPGFSRRINTDESKSGSPNCQPSLHLGAGGTSEAAPSSAPCATYRWIMSIGSALSKQASENSLPAPVLRSKTAFFRDAGAKKFT